MVVLSMPVLRPEGSVAFSSRSDDTTACASNWRNLILPLRQTHRVPKGVPLQVDSCANLRSATPSYQSVPTTYPLLASSSNQSAPTTYHLPSTHSHHALLPVSTHHLPPTSHPLLPSSPP